MSVDVGFARAAVDVGFARAAKDAPIRRWDGRSVWRGLARALSSLFVLIVVGCSCNGPTPAPGVDGGVAPRCDAPAIDDAERQGLACEHDDDCAGARCVRAAAAAVDGEVAPLVCDVVTSGDGVGQPCETGATCATGLCVVAGTCVGPCAADADCLPGSECRILWTSPDGASHERAQVCVPRFVVPDDAETSRTEPELRGGVLELPAGAGLHVVRPGCNRPALAPRLETVGGEQLFDFDVLVARGPAPINPLGFDLLPLTMLIPNSPVHTPGDEGYRVPLLIDTNDPVELLTVRADAPGSLLDIDLYTVGVSDDATSPRMVLARAALDAALASAGASVGEVRVHRVVGEVADRLGIIDFVIPAGFEEFDELYSLGAAPPGPSVAVFLVRRVDIVTGLAGGIPGPLGVPGIEGAGVTLGAEALVGDDAFFAQAFAHEMLHYLGLFHTSESDGTIPDPLPDTPECRIDADTNGNLQVTPDECAGRGADNLMFWQPAGSVVTQDQADVLRRTVILR